MADMTGAVLAARVVVEGTAKAKQDLDDMGTKASEAQGTLGRLLGKIGDFAGASLAFAGVNAGLSGLVAGIAGIFGMDEGVETTTTAFTKLLGSSKAATDEIARLQQFSAATPLELPDVEKATQKLLGYQFQLSQTEPILTSVGDALSATGNLNSATLDQVITVFGQMHSSISLHTQDLMQLSSVGINAFQVLADSITPTKDQINALVKDGLIKAGDAAGYLSGKTKLTQGDIQQLVTQGLIPSQQGIDALTQGIEKNPIYQGGMAAQSQTTAGKISTLKDNLSLAVQHMSQPIFSRFSDLIGHIGDAVSSPAFQNFATTVGQNINTAITNTTTAVQNAVTWFQQWHGPILAVAGAITAFFLPAIIQTGVESVIAGTKTSASFVMNIIKSGTESTIAAAKVWVWIGSVIASGTQAVIAGAKATASFIASIITSGTESVIAGAKVTASFVASMLKAGAQAVVSGAQVLGSFVAAVIEAGPAGQIAAMKGMLAFTGSMITAGTQAVLNGAKITASFVGSLIATGARAVITGATLTAQFVASMVRTGAQAVVTGGMMLASLVPALISVIAQAVVAAATAIPGLIAGFIAWTISAGSAAIATIAATWPILAVIAAIGLLIAIIIIIAKNWDTIWNAIKATAEKVIGAVTGWVNGIIDTIKNGLGGAIQWLQDKWNDVWNGLADIAKGAWDNVKGALASGINVAIDLINDLIDGANKLPFVNIPHIPHVHFAQGGVAPGGMAIVGEHGPEPIFLPRGTRVLSHEDAMAALAGAGTGGGRGGNTYNITLSTMFTDTDALARGLTGVLKRQELLHR